MGLGSFCKKQIVQFETVNLLILWNPAHIKGGTPCPRGLSISQSGVALPLCIPWNVLNIFFGSIHIPSGYVVITVLHVSLWASNTKTGRCSTIFLVFSIHFQGFLMIFFLVRHIAAVSLGSMSSADRSVAHTEPRVMFPNWSVFLLKFVRS